MSNDAPAIDDAANRRFVIEEDGAVAELTYHRNRSRLVLLHTGVPDEISGRGIAGVWCRPQSTARPGTA